MDPVDLDRSIEGMELFCKLMVERDEERCRQITNWMKAGRKMVHLLVAGRNLQRTDAEPPASPEDLDSIARDISQADQRVKSQQPSSEKGTDLDDTVTDCVEVADKYVTEAAVASRELMITKVATLHTELKTELADSKIQEAFDSGIENAVDFEETMESFQSIGLASIPDVSWRTKCDAWWSLWESIRGKTAEFKLLAGKDIDKGLIAMITKVNEICISKHILGLHANSEVIRNRKGGALRKGMQEVQKTIKSIKMKPDQLPDRAYAAFKDGFKLTPAVV